MEHFIGERLSFAIEELEKQGLNYKIIDNNFNVVGDEKLITNVIAKENTVVLVTGEFIFNVKGKNNENKQ